MVVIGITGTNGAGKGTVVEHLKKEYGFSYFSFRDFFIEEIKRRDMEINRDSMRIVANDLRKTHGPAYVFDTLYERAITNNVKRAVFDSIRSVAEARRVKERGGILLAVDANPRMRYKRIQKRRSASDAVDFETFLAQEEKEKHSVDETKQNLAGCIAMADYVIVNEGTFEALHDQIDTMISPLL